MGFLTKASVKALRREVEAFTSNYVEALVRSLLADP